MNALQKVSQTGLFVLVAIFVINSCLYAQTESNDRESQQYKELVQFQTKHIIEQDENAQALSEIMTGISMQTPEEVFLAEMLLTEDPAALKKAILNEAIDEDIPVGEFEFVEYDDLFAGGDDGNGSGFGIGVSAGHCPPGGRY